jgi:hypothetical protein
MNSKANCSVSLAFLCMFGGVSKISVFILKSFWINYGCKPKY